MSLKTISAKGELGAGFAIEVNCGAHRIIPPAGYSQL